MIKSIKNQNLKAAYSVIMNVRRNTTSTETSKQYEHFSVSTPKPNVVHVELNRPKLNALTQSMWIELGTCFNDLNEDQNCRAIVLSGAGKLFCAGLDLMDAAKWGQETSEIDEVARRGRALEKIIKLYQDSVSSIEKCVKPVIAAVHSACVGAGVDIIATADIRYCTKDAWFQVKEVDIGMAADVGTLQRLPKVIGNQGLVRELCYTARKLESKEAESCGLVNKVFDTKEEMIQHTIELAEMIAQKSPVAVQTTKQNLIYSLDHTNQEGLDHIRILNKLNLQSEDFFNAAMAQATSKGKNVPVFAKL